MVHDYKTFRKHKFLEVIPIHLYEAETEYKITLNPKFEGAMNKRNFMIWCREQYVNLRQLENCHIKVYPELSDTLRPHLHGTIEIGKDLNEFIFTDYQYILNYGQIEISLYDGLKPEEIEVSFNAWIVYCTKGKHLTEKYCNYGYPIDNKRQFNTGTERPTKDCETMETNRQLITNDLDDIDDSDLTIEFGN